MKIVIEIDEETYNDIKRGKIYSSYRDVPQESVVAIANGTPLQKEHGDAVSRDAVLDLVADYDLSMGQVVKGIHALPPVTSKPKMGRWIIKDGKEQGYDIAGIKTWYIQIMCDKCGFIKTAIEWNAGQYKFCPYCGQPKMQEVEE